MPNPSKLQSIGQVGTLKYGCQRRECESWRRMHRQPLRGKHWANITAEPHQDQTQCSLKCVAAHHHACTVRPQRSASRSTVSLRPHPGQPLRQPPLVSPAQQHHKMPSSETVAYLHHCAAVRLPCNAGVAPGETCLALQEELLSKRGCQRSAVEAPGTLSSSVADCLCASRIPNCVCIPPRHSCTSPCTAAVLTVTCSQRRAAKVVTRSTIWVMSSSCRSRASLRCHSTASRKASGS